MEIVRGKKLKNKLSIIVISIIVGILLLVMGIISYAKSNEEITTLSILTKNGDSTVNLSGAKYTIKKVTQDKDGKEIEEEAKDFKGNLIGNIENINGTDYRVIESDKNGEINLDLKSGKYRVTEVQAPTGYKLNDNNTYEANLEAKGKKIKFFLNKECEKEYEVMSEDSGVTAKGLAVLDIKETTGEEYIALVEIVGDYTIPTEEMENGKLKELQKGIFIFRYSSDNRISEIVELVGNDTNYLKTSSYSMNNRIDIIAETDEYYIIGVADEVLIYFNKSGELEKITAEEYGIPVATQMSIVDENNNITTIGEIYNRTVIPAEKTTNNKEIILEKKEDGYNTILIQFSKDGKVNWATLLGRIEIGTKEIIEKDNKYLTSVYIENNITIEGYNTSSGENIELEPGSYKLYFNKDGKVEEFNKSKNPLFAENNDNFEIPIEILTLDGGEIFQLRNYEQYTISSEWTTEGKDIILDWYESYIIKVNEEEKVEWILKIGDIYNLFEIDNGYIITGDFYDEIDPNDTVAGEPIEDIDTSIPVEVKLNKNGKIMYVKNIKVINKEEQWGYIIQDVIELENNKYVYLKDCNAETSSNLYYFTKLEKNIEIKEEREEIDKKIINVTNNQEESLQIIKKDSRTAKLLPGAKFTIKRINENNGNITKEDAVDKDGKLIGNIENINGKDLRVVTTNEKGEINESLPIGKYEIVEVKAPEGYYLKPNVEENTYEVEITEQQEEKKGWKKNWNRIVGSKCFRIPQSMDQIYDENSGTGILEKDETGVIVYLDLDNTIKAEDTENNEEIIVEANSSFLVFLNLDTLKIKKIMYLPYNYESYEIEQIEDGYIAVGGFDTETVIPGKYTASGKDIEILEIYNDYIFKYNNDGKIIYILKGDNLYEEKIENGYKIITVDDIYDFESQYTLTIMDSKYNIIKEIKGFLLETSDGGYIYNKEYETNTTITKENNTTGEDLFVNKGRYLVKENKEGKIEWFVENTVNTREIFEIDNKYFGRFEEDKGNCNYEFGFFKISQETIKEQLTNKKVINITNESDVGKIVTKYVDKATNKEIAVSEEITDRVGADYETKAKEIEYYKLEGTPENAKGKVTNGTTEVIYYYNKQDFNIKADKTISELYVNGEKQDIKNNKNNIFQVSINRKEVAKTDLKIRYIIRISNTGEIPGTAGKVTDQIPEGLEFHQEDNPDYWKLENGVAITDKLDNKVILPGQFEELEIILRCSNLEDKLGVKTNHVVAENMNNESNFEDTNKEDDKGKCDLIVSIGLGGTDIIAILGVSTISLIVVAKVINKFRKRSK